MRSTLQPLARAASTAKWGVSARTAQSARGGSSAISESVVVAITNACAICCYIATLARKKKGAIVGQSPSSIRRAPLKRLCTILPQLPGAPARSR